VVLGKPQPDFADLRLCKEQTVLALLLSSAKVAVVISGTSEWPTDSFDCGLACQSMSIAAMVLGYGTRIISSPGSAIDGKKREYFHKLLGIPEGMHAVAILLIGISEERVDAITGATPRKAPDEVVTYVRGK
jgi:nitroreductase